MHLVEEATAGATVMLAGMTRLLMFDIDGTLTATNGMDTECFVRAMSEHLGGPIDSDWARYPHVTDSGIAATLLAEHQRPVSDRAVVQRRFVELVEESLRLNPACGAEIAGAAAFLRRVRERRGWVAGLATGGWSGSARAKLRHAGIDVEGVALASADDAEARMEIMTICRKRVVERVGDVAEIVYVGDGPWDMKATRELGWRFVGIGERIRAERQQRGEDFPVFRDFTDGDAVLQALGAP